MVLYRPHEWCRHHKGYLFYFSQPRGAHMSDILKAMHFDMRQFML
jgi:hypothetical protein